MTGRDIKTYAMAHVFEKTEQDALVNHLSLPLINLGLAELTEAENKFRKNAAVMNETEYIPLTEPVFINNIEDDVEYCYQVTTILLPLWLAWKIFEGMDDTSRGAFYQSLYEAKYAAIVPITGEWVQMQDNALGQIDAEEATANEA